MLACCEKTRQVVLGPRSSVRYQSTQARSTSPEEEKDLKSDTAED